MNKTVTLSILATLAATAHSQTTLVKVKDPSGGTISCGPIEGAKSAPAAIGAVLRGYHHDYGAKPQVGRFFQDPGHQTVGTFFLVDGRRAGHGQLEGLLIVTTAGTAAPNVAVLTDTPDHFGQSLRPMLQKLNATWHPVPPSATGAPVARQMDLNQQPFSDRSGSIGVPDGWRIDSSRAGSVLMSGPDGEKLHFGAGFTVLDPNAPGVQQQVGRLTRGGMMPLPGAYLCAPYQGDIRSNFNLVMQEIAQKRHVQPATIDIKGANQNELDGGAKGAEFFGTIDTHDGAGPRYVDFQWRMQPYARSQSAWNLQISEVDLPNSVAKQDLPVVAAIMRSYSLDPNKLSQIGNQVSGKIKAFGNYVHNRIKNSEDREDEILREGRQASDANEKEVQGFCNNLLEQSVVVDKASGEHGTLDNNYASALVEGNPDRFQYVPFPNFLRGIDY